METEIFLVMSNRHEGLPGMEKACDEKFYWTEDEAQRHAAKINEEIGPYYGAYRALIKVTNRVK